MQPVLGRLSLVRSPQLVSDGMFLDSLIELFRNHQIVAIAIVVGFAVLVYFKPKPMFQLAGVVLLIGAIGYVVSFLVDLTSTGVDHTTSFMGNPGK